MIDEWFGCYPSQWKGIITPESYAHPAKFSSRLIERIYQHAMDCGWMVKGSRIVDPFGGVGLGAWPALRYGMNWCGVELEPRFVALAQANIDAWNATYKGRLARWGEATIIQGDSRNLAQLVGQAQAAISSPPFTDSLESKDESFIRKAALDATAGKTKGHGSSQKYLDQKATWNGYGATPGQLGALKAGDFQATISSPPFIDGQPLANPAKTYKGFEHVGSVKLGQDGYGSTPGQLGSMPPGQPPEERDSL